MSYSVIGCRRERIIKHFEKLMLTIITLVIFLAACSQKGEYDFKIFTEEQESEYSSVYAEVIEFSEFKDKEFQSEINMQISEGIKDSIKEFDVVAQESAELLPKGVKSVTKITQNIKRNKGEIISFIEEGYIYLGGAHGNTVWTPRTLDLRMESPHILSLSELFIDQRYIEKINNLIDKLVKENPDKYSELWAEPHIDSNFQINFYLTEEELVIFFHPYELSYYAKGFIEFPIRLNDLSGWIKEEYLKKDNSAEIY